MNTHHRRLLIVLFVALMGCFALGASAQGESAGTLTLGTPAVSQIITAGQTFNYDYSISAPRQVVLQALAESAPPTITILQDGALVASEPNLNNALTVSLDAFLNTGNYTVQVGAKDGATGLVILVLQSETEAPSTVLTTTTPISGMVNDATPFALYSFDALTEPAYLYIESTAPQSGVTARLVLAADATVIGEMDANLLGARFRIPGSGAGYMVEIEAPVGAGDSPFTLCLAAVSVGGCETGSAPAPQATVEVALETPDQYCRVASATNSPVNIRQSASTAAIIVASLPVGSSADVIGISPDGTFYNVLYSGSNGWVALSVVSSTGNCADILTITPPTVIQPQNPPAQPPAQPTVPPPPTASGPCLITMTGDMLIYTQPNAIPDYIYDQVHTGYQLIPTGRLSDNSWWQTNYASAWVQLSLLAGVGQITGDCSALPVIG